MALQEVYSQAPLITERREIRILALAPGTGDDVLRGDLIVESLNYDDLHYTALSYTWSGPVSESAIIMGGVTLHITENLESALRRVRGPTRAKNLWVDAICINQNDYEDKKVQVSLMGHIYASATRTLVWLGESSAESDVAMEYIASLRHRDLDRPDSDRNVDQLPLQAVTDLMQRKWWTRIWVVQEALMSRRVIVACGQKEVDMVYFIKFVKETGIEAHLLVRDEQEEPQLPLQGPSVSMALTAKFERKASSEQPFFDILSNWYVYKHEAETGGLSLLKLMLLTHGFQASVQRDKIFALLGLATPEVRSWIIPDYSDAISHRLFLIRLTAYFLRFSSLPLQLADLCGATDYPSWVPDWTALDSRGATVLKKELEDHPMKYTEQLPPPNNENARYNPHLEPPVQNLGVYQEPTVLLVHGLILCQVKIAFAIPGIDDGTGEGSQTGTLSFKAKIREWESRMSQEIEIDMGRVKWNEGGVVKTGTSHLPPRAAKKQGQEIKFSLITYLVNHRPSVYGNSGIGNFYRQISQLRNRFDKNDHEAKDLIKNYEEWMQSPGYDACELSKDTPHGSSNPHARFPRSSDPGASKELGQKIVASNANKTLFLTEQGDHYVETFAVNEGDMVCWLWRSYAHFIMRKADDEHWTIVGCLHEARSDFGQQILLGSRMVNKVFRLK